MKTPIAFWTAVMATVIFSPSMLANAAEVATTIPTVPAPAVTTTDKASQDAEVRGEAFRKQIKADRTANRNIDPQDNATEIWMESYAQEHGQTYQDANFRLELKKRLDARDVRIANWNRNHPNQVYNNRPKLPPTYTPGQPLNGLEAGAQVPGLNCNCSEAELRASRAEARLRELERNDDLTARSHRRHDDDYDSDAARRRRDRDDDYDRDRDRRYSRNGNGLDSTNPNSILSQLFGGNGMFNQGMGQGNLQQQMAMQQMMQQQMGMNRFGGGQQPWGLGMNNRMLPSSYPAPGGGWGNNMNMGGFNNYGQQYGMFGGMQLGGYGGMYGGAGYNAPMMMPYQGQGMLGANIGFGGGGVIGGGAGAPPIMPYMQGGSQSPIYNGTAPNYAQYNTGGGAAGHGNLPPTYHPTH